MQRSAARSSVTGLVLAGGRGRRFGGADKGLLPIAGRPMVEYVLDALRPQVGAILVNANRNAERYAAYGHPVIPDALDGYLGPLAGISSALSSVDTEFMVTVPCDAPLLAADLVRRLHDACMSSGVDAALAADGNRTQPLFLLLRVAVAPSLRDYLQAGGRKVETWLGQMRATTVDCSDLADTFANVNDAGAWRRVEGRLLGTADSHSSSMA